MLNPWTRVPPMLVCKYVDQNGLTAMLTSWYHTKGKSEESVESRSQSMQARESILALKPRADVTRSPKHEYQWPHKKTDVLRIFVTKTILGVALT